jgi:hypothetical protein
VVRPDTRADHRVRRRAWSASTRTRRRRAITGGSTPAAHHTSSGREPRTPRSAVPVPADRARIEWVGVDATAVTTGHDQVRPVRFCLQNPFRRPNSLYRSSPPILRQHHRMAVLPLGSRQHSGEVGAERGPPAGSSSAEPVRPENRRDDHRPGPPARPTGTSSFGPRVQRGRCRAVASLSLAERITFSVNARYCALSAHLGRKLARRGRSLWDGRSGPEGPTGTLAA